MSVKGIRGTYAMRAEHSPQPAPVYTQEQLADRLRKSLSVTLGGDWSLTAEVVAICEPRTDNHVCVYNDDRCAQQITLPHT